MCQWHPCMALLSERYCTTQRGGCLATREPAGGGRLRPVWQCHHGGADRWGWSSGIHLWPSELIIIIIMYIYHVLINTLSTHMIHINLNMISYTQVEHSPTKTAHQPTQSTIQKYNPPPPPPHCSWNWVLILVGVKLLWEEGGFHLVGVNSKWGVQSKRRWNSWHGKLELFDLVSWNSCPSVLEVLIQWIRTLDLVC